MKSPYLFYEFRDRLGNNNPMVFSNPEKVLQTYNLEEVPTIFQQLEDYTKKGYYAAGYVAYEAAPAFDSNMAVHRNGKYPLIWFGIFGHPLSWNEESDPEEGFAVSEWELNTSPVEYRKRIEQIKRAIEEGDTYQVNYTDRLSARFEGSDFSFYRQLTRNQESDYSAYLNLGDFRILSASPELFFSVEYGKLKTKPMKGTAPRGRTIKEDEKLIHQLSTSKKEQAENLMIVDLLRNDLSKIAKPGSVKVTHLFEAETYPTVHQLTSTIEADLKENSSLLDWFRALFPCGSITGAPKISTMRYISELESSPREVYCGAIGFITPERNAKFNVPIRTVLIDKKNNSAVYGVGGGITWDSTSAGEYQELHAKAKLLTEHRPVFHLLESLKLENGNYPLLPYHLKRLEDSAAYFNFTLDKIKIEEALLRYSESNRTGCHKVRLLAKKSGQFSVESSSVHGSPEVVSAVLASEPVSDADPFLFHKTTNRSVYNKLEESKPKEVFAVLMWNQSNEVTEFTIGNVVMEIAGRYYTPPLSSGLLPGTFRQYLLDNRRIEEKVFHKDQLNEVDAVWFINSVRGWIKVNIVHSP